MKIFIFIFSWSYDPNIQNPNQSKDTWEHNMHNFVNTHNFVKKNVRRRRWGEKSLRCKQGKVDSSWLLVKKLTCSHEKVLMYWKYNLFCIIINMMIIFYFIFKNLKNPILKVRLSRILKNVSTCTKCPILQNGLYIDEILI